MERNSSRMVASLRFSVFLAVAVLVGISQGDELDWPGFGRINGTTTTSAWKNKLIYQFQGIPFALPPVDGLRFKRPEKYVETWEGVREFTDFGPICYQSVELNETGSRQSEDCLTLNVYTTKLDGGGNGTGLPVLVYIHGGQFRGGSARGYAPNYLLDKEDMVLVTPQYRLGPFGFLSLKTEQVPGNQGMLDLVMALEWVRDNIEYFGGDPNRITICGQSAGAAAVTLLLFTPLLEEGLIKGVIAQSGSALGTWVPDPDPVTHARQIALAALCRKDDPDELAVCLRSKSARAILTAHLAFLGADGATGGRFVGGNHIVYDEAGEKSFLLKDPAVLLDEGSYKKVPLIAGVNKHEGSDFIALMYDVIINPFNLDDGSEASTFFLSNKITKMTLEYGGIEDRTGFVTGFTQDKYFDETELGNFTAMTPGLVDILGVALLKACTFTMAKEMSRYTDTYLYAFNYFGEHSTFSNSGRYPFNGGISHSDELFYLFPMGRVLNEKDDAVAQRMTEFWTSFTKNQRPIADGMIEWPTVSTPNGPYMKIEPFWVVHDNFMEEYMIADTEGMTEPDRGSAYVAQVSILAMSLTFFICLFN